MKNILKLLSVSSLLLITLWACKKDENKDFFLGGTPPVLTSQTNTGADSVSMVPADSSKMVILFSWTNPNYKFTTGVSSQNVNYQLQIDSVGNNFNPAKTAVISVSQDLSYNLLESQLNSMMLNTLGLDTSVSYQMEARVVSGIGANNAVPSVSNVFTFSAIPYAIPPKVPPPASKVLYITGSATAGGWMASGDKPIADQQFTQVSRTLYEITVALTGGGSYTFVPVYGNWDNKYSIATKDDPNEVNGGPFQVGGNDILAPANDGTYKITVDFQRGIFTVVKQ
jgi:hypothetical protein